MQSWYSEEISTLYVKGLPLLSVVSIALPFRIKLTTQFMLKTWPCKKAERAAGEQWRFLSEAELPISDQNIILIMTTSFGVNSTLPKLRRREKSTEGVRSSVQKERGGRAIFHRGPRGQLFHLCKGCRSVNQSLCHFQLFQ